MLQTLLMAAAQQVQQPDLWAVAGNYLVRIALGSEAANPQLIPLPTEAGPLRSVQLIDGQILAGAQKGVIVMDVKNLANPELYLDPDLNSEHGFTHGAMDGHSIT